MTRDERGRWLAWIDGVIHGPLRPLFEHPHAAALVRPPILEALWCSAAREVAARVLLGAARERMVDASVASGVLTIRDLAPDPIALPLLGDRPFELHRVDLEALEGHPTGDLLATGLGLRSGPAWMLGPLFDHEGCTADARGRVTAELVDAVHNLAGARLAQGLRHVLACHLPAGAGADSNDPRLTDPEHFVTEGHPWHPMARTRLGLRRADVLRHAPELLAGTLVTCVDVEAELVQQSGDWSSLATACFGPAVDGRVRLPIHPVQRRRLSRLFPQAWARGALRPTAVAIPARSLLSMRTVVLPDQPLHLKLALGVHTTSARRQVSPMSVANGPAVSELLLRIQGRDPLLANLEIMAEPAAAGLCPDRAGPRAGELGAILRAAPRDPANTWVCAAIDERWPGSDERVLERACAGYPGDRSTRLRALIGDWLRELVPPCLRLLSHHGVVLEVHLQNTLVRIEGGRLRGFAIRDLGGIRLHGPRLAAAGHEIALAPGSFIVTEDLEEVRGKLEHTLFHAHLAHLFAVADDLGVPALESWGRLRGMIDACYRAWAGEPDASAGLRRDLSVDHERLLAPRVRAKALFRMRMHDRVSDYEYVALDNVLAQVTGDAGFDRA